MSSPFSLLSRDSFSSQITLLLKAPAAPGSSMERPWQTNVAYANEAEAGANEIVVFPNDPSNPYWGASCEVPGCVYPEALNYNEAATKDDFSCYFTENPCPSDLNFDGITGTQDLLMFLVEFGLSCN
jgi:hypothetical protein